MRLIFALILSLWSANAAHAAACSQIPALPDTERRTQYSISASTGPLNVGFQIYGDGTDFANWVAVYVNGVLQSGSTYTVTSPTTTLATGCRPISDAQVTFTAAQTGTVQIVGAQRPRRLSQVSENQGVSAHDFNQLQTALTAMEREAWDLRNRTVQGVPGETLAILPPAASRANQNATFDGSGNLTASLPVGGGAPISAAMQPVVNAATIAVAQALLGIPLSGYDATQINYTPTGGIATTVAKVLNRTLWANDFGAVCDSVTSDSTAFQNTATEGQILGVAVRFVGACKFTSQVTISASLDFRGISPYASLITVGPGVSPLLINTQSSVYLSDFGIAYTSANLNDTAITVTAPTENGNSRICNLQINGANIGINFLRASGFVLCNNVIAGITTNGIGIWVANSNGVDQGDSTAYGNTIVVPGAGVGAVLWNSSGGFRFNNNKILGASGPSTGWSCGVCIQLTSGAVTGDIFIQDNSIEGISNSGHSVDLLRLGATGSLSHVLITGNELGGGQVCVNEAVDANGSWLNAVTIANNNCQTVNTSSSVGYNLGTTVSGLSITGGVVWLVGGGTNTPVILATQTATNCVVGPFAKKGTMGASSLSSCASYAPN